MAQTLVYISKTGDKDLLGLLNHIGMKNFRKVVRQCMCALSDSAYVNKAKETVRSISDGENHATESSFGVGIKIRVQLDPFSQKLLEELEAGSTSMFVKTTVRQVLGPQLLLSYLIKANSDIQIQEVPFVSLINIGQVVHVKESRERTKRPKKTNVTRSAKSGVQVVPDKSAAEPDNQEVSARATDAPSFSAPDSPSFGPSFSAPAHNNFENADSSPVSSDTADNDDFDVLSMLEAML